MTENACKLVTPLPFKSLSKNEVITDIFSANAVIAHISIVDWCDMAVIAPASYNIIGKIANGIADDAVTTIIAACKKPVLAAPAMNTNMYENNIFLENLEKLKKINNFHVIEAEAGYLACGTTGKGRMAEPAHIMNTIEKVLNSANDLKGAKIMVTAGPTREYIDTVRFMTNPSTGKMGYALAKRAAERGAEVTLISGPCSIKADSRISNKIDIVTTDEMKNAVLSSLNNTNALISAAAPCDFKFSEKFDEKVAKKEILDSAGIKLVPTGDILKAVAKEKTNQIIIGFAAEDNNHVTNAKRKLKEKSMDMIVLNDVSKKETGFAADFNEITIISSDGDTVNYPRLTKENCADIILDRLKEALKQKNVL